MIRSPRWLLITSVLFALFFVGSGVGLLLAPPETALGLFNVTPADISSSAALFAAFSNAFYAMHVRNITIGAFTAIVAFFDARATLVLWALRLIIELGDLAGVLASGALSNLPVFAVIITLELVVLVLGFRHLRQSRLAA